VTSSCPTTSALRASGVSTLAKLQFSRTSQSTDMCLPNRMVSINPILWEILLHRSMVLVVLISMVLNYFGTLGNSFSSASLYKTFRSTKSLKWEIWCCVSLLMDGLYELRASSLQEFCLFASVFFLKWLSTGVQDLLPHVHFDQQSGSTLALHSFKILGFPYSLSFFLLPPEVRDRLTHVPCLNINGHEWLRRLKSLTL